MVEFLSAAWFDALGSIEVPADPALTFRLDQTITDAPEGVIRYRVTLAAGRLSVVRDAVDGPADATLRLRYPTAVELARGRRTAHDALLAREIVFDGDPGRVQDLAGALGAIGSALGAMRDDTSWPPEPP